MKDALRRLVPQPLAERYATLSPRERRLVAIGGTLVLLALFWAFAWQPLSADVERRRLDLAAADATLLRLAAAVREDAGLERAAAAAPATDPRGAAQRVLAARGLAAGASVEPTGDRVRVVLPAVDLGALVGALDALARDERLRALDLQLLPRVEPGTLRAEFTLVR